MAELKEILKILREESNLSQAALADELGVGVSTVASWETGNRFPRRPYMEQLADYFNVDIDYLYGRTDIRQNIHFDNDGHMMVHLSNDEYSLIQNFRSLNSSGQKYIIQTVAMALNSYRSDDTPTIKRA